MSADSLGFGELQSFLAGYISFQYLSASCIMAMMKDLSEICGISSAPGDASPVGIWSSQSFLPGFPGRGCHSTCPTQGLRTC